MNTILSSRPIQRRKAQLLGVARLFWLPLTLLPLVGLNLSAQSPPMPPPYKPPVVPLHSPKGKALFGSRVLMAKTVAPKTVANPYKTLLFSFVAKQNDAGMLVSTGGVSTIVITNAGLFFDTRTVRLLQSSPPSPRVKKGVSTALVLPSGPVQNGFYVNWDANMNIFFDDVTSLVAGRTYFQQISLDGKTWSNTGNTLLWESTDPTAYWRAGIGVPAQGNYNAMFRIYSP